MGSTLAQLRARVRSQLPDADGSYVLDADIDTFINEAYLDLADRLDAVEHEYTGTTSGDTITLPPSGTSTVKRVTSLRIDDVGVAFVDDDTFALYSLDTTDPDFTIGRIFNGVIELFPTPPNATAYELRAVIIPAVLTSSDTQALPMWCERKLVDFGCYRALVKCDELIRAQGFLVTYEQSLPEPSLGKDRTIAGPLTLAYVTGPFDLDINAQHL